MAEGGYIAIPGLSRHISGIDNIARCIWGLVISPVNSIPLEIDGYRNVNKVPLFVDICKNLATNYHTAIISFSLIIAV